MSKTIPEKLADTTKAAERLGAAMRKAMGTEAVKIERASARRTASRAAAKALADYLIVRDWPNATPREVSVHHRSRYGSMAAAILNGKAWAIRAAWPEGAYEIEGTRAP